MFLPNWHKRLSLSHTNRNQRRRRKHQPRLESLEPRTLLSVNPTGETIAPTEVFDFTTTVAEFTASDAGPFTATIDWGDGNGPTTGTVSAAGGGVFDVNGSHSYAEDGPYTLTITIADAADLTTATVQSTAQVAEATTGEAPFAVTAGGSISAAEGQVLTGVQLATFQDFETSDPGQFTASIDWGDGVTTPGSISTLADFPGSFIVTGDHTYADELSGNYTVTIQEPSANFTATPVSNSVSVAERDTLTPSSVTTGTIRENELVGGTAAVFGDLGYPGNNPADFTGTFDWGDGTTYTTGAGNATVTSDGAGHFTLSVSAHSYADEGVYTVVATLTDNAPGTASDAQTGTLTVAEADAFAPSATPVTFTGTEGTAASGSVAVFADAGYPNNDAADMTATIDWGDGSIGAGSVSTAGDGNFTVSGNHTYAEDGAYTITASIAEDAPGTANATTTATANIAEADLSLTPAAAFAATEGSSATAIVAFVNDSGTTDSAGAYSSTINWGDGTASAGTVSGSESPFTVTGHHTYVDEGSFTITVTTTETSAVPAATATTTLVEVVAEGDSGSLIAATITPTEGGSFNGAVASFTDTGNPLQIAGDFTASVDWGDGTATAGTVTGPTGGPFTISGGHTYADEGTYTVLASFSDDPPSTLTDVAITSTAIVAEADAFTPSATPVTFTGTEGTAASGTVAVFADSGYPNNDAADMTATIDWGDGSIGTGSVSTAGDGNFTVSSSHIYADEGSFPITVTLIDDAPGTATATATATAVVAEGDTLVPGAATLSATEGKTFTGSVASFSDTTYTDNPPTDFTATIDWGDGTTTTGTIAGVAGPGGSASLVVSGDHLYADEGGYSLTVILTDGAPGTAAATATGTASVADNDTLAPGPNITASSTEGATFTGALATFTDATYAGNVPGDFTASIDWGDGSTGTGSVSTAGDGNITVSGSHVYAEEGSPTATIVLADDAPGTATGTATATINVADAPLSAAATTLTPTEGASFTAVVATFTDADPGATVADYKVTIDWNDGTRSVGSVAANGGGVFQVTGTHTFAEEGTNAVTVTISDVGGSTATANSTAIISDAPLAAAGVAVTPTEGIAFTGVVATFTDADPGGAVSDYATQIVWGDGTTTTGTVAANVSGGFDVSGTHTYAEEGTYNITVAMLDRGGSKATANSIALVTDAPLTATAATITATEGASFTVAVASFTDADPAGVAGDYTATIDWGDGTTSAGSIAANGGGFQVKATHTYLEEGVDSPRVIIRDAGGSTATVQGAAHVADAPLTAAGVTLTPTELTAFTGTVATFTDADPNGTLSDYAATVDWGDGTSSAGAVAATSGGFMVNGSHTYAQEGTFTVTVTVADVGGSSATATSAADVAPAAISGTAVPISGFERTPLVNVPVATFLHANGGETVGNFNVTIDWGDGTSSTGTVSESGTTYTVTGTHNYLDEGTFAVTVRISDGSTSATITTAAAILEELLPDGTVGTLNQRFVQEIYRDLLHRAVDPSALAYWTPMLDQGVSRQQVAQEIVAAAMPGELGADLVTGIFEKFLGRAPDPSGMAFWITIVSQRETLEDTEANVVGTPEFFYLAGSTDAGFITRLFRLGLGRNPEPSAVSYFETLLANGITREQVAEIIFNSLEYHELEVSGYYQSPVDLNDRSTGIVPFIDDLDFLDRPVDPGGLAMFSIELQRDTTDQQVWAQLLASDEFFAKIAQ